MLVLCLTLGWILADGHAHPKPAMDQNWGFAPRASDERRMVDLQLTAAAVLMDVRSLAALSASVSLQPPPFPLWGAEGTPWSSAENVSFQYRSRGVQLGG